MDTVLVETIDQRLHDMLLSDQVLESTWPPLARQHLVTHEDPRSAKPAASQSISALCVANLNIVALNSIHPVSDQTSNKPRHGDTQDPETGDDNRRIGGNPCPPFPGARVCCCRCSLPGLTGFTAYRRGEAGRGHH